MQWSWKFVLLLHSYFGTTSLGINISLWSLFHAKPSCYFLLGQALHSKGPMPKSEKQGREMEKPGLSLSLFPSFNQFYCSSILLRKLGKKANQYGCVTNLPKKLGRFFLKKTSYTAKQWIDKNQVVMPTST